MLDDEENLGILDQLELDDGSVEVTLGDLTEEEDESLPSDASKHDANLAMFMTDEQLDALSYKLEARFNDDFASNSEYFHYLEEQIPRLGLNIERINEPFPDATPVVHPLIMENAVKTSAKIIGEVFCGAHLVDVYVYNTVVDEIKEKANAIRKFMDWQYLNQMPEYIPETEQMALRYAIVGEAFRKYSWDSLNNRPRAYYVTEDRFIVNSTQKALCNVDFHTEIISMPMHVYKTNVAKGLYREYEDAEPVPGDSLATGMEQVINQETGDSQGFAHGADALDDIELHEHHAYLELEEPFNDNEERPLPYIVIRDSHSHKILSIRRNWKEKDPNRLKRQWYSHYKLLPGLGFHGLGYVHLLGNFQFALTQIARSLIDAGQFANLQGGFKAKGVRWTKEGRMPIRFGEFREIETQQRPISEVIYPLNFKEPSQVLYTLFAFLDGRAQKFADSTEQVIADSTNYGPVGTTVALLEASTKFINGILKRFYNSLKDEFRILYDLNYDTMDEQMTFFMRGEVFEVKREYFAGSVDVIPSADPNMASTAHRLSIANTKLDAALKSPQIHSLPAAYRDFYSCLGMEKEEIDVLLPPPQTAQQGDPLTDIITLQQGKPIKAYPGQDHDAHIQAKTAFLNDPQGGKNPLLGAMMPLLQANIAEHQMLKYVERAQAAMGQIGPDVIAQIGQEKAVAVAAEALLKINNMETNAKNLEIGDPATILAVAESKNADTKQMEAQIKAQTEAEKIKIANDKLDLERLKLGQKDAIDRKTIQKDMIMQRRDQGAKMVDNVLTNLKAPKDKK